MTLRAPLRMGAALLIALAAAEGARAAEDEAVKPVKLPAEIQAKLGLKSEALKAKTAAATVSGFVRVLDPGPLAQLDSDIEAAKIAAQASAAEAARSKALNADSQAVSAKQVEQAEAQARSDAAKLALLRRRVGIEWGEGIARMTPRQLARLLADIAAGRAALVRIDTPSGEGLAGLRAVDLDLGSFGVVHARVLGPARSADPRLLSPGVIAEASGASVRSLAVGLAAPVKLPVAGPVSGVVAPRAALVRDKGKTWVYVRQDGDSFLRKAVEDGRPDAGGLFVAAGLKPGQQVVTQGAAALFAAETNVSEEGGEKGDD